jgi:hypothetical protein
MRLSKITRKQVEQVLKENPIHEVLNIDKSALTPKQLKYAESVARGDNKTTAYRKAYNTKGKKATQNRNAHKVGKNDKVQTMIEAIKRGLEWERSYSLSQTRALVVERLTKEALDEDSSPSARINALKALGTVAGVDAFIHRTETTVIKDSSKIRDDLMKQLKAAMQANTIDMDAEAEQLLAEIAPPKQKMEDADPPDPDPHLGKKESHQIQHSTPDKRSPSAAISQKLVYTNTEIPEQNQEVPEQVATLPVDLEGGRGDKNDPQWEEKSIGEAPPLSFKTKG